MASKTNKKWAMVIDQERCIGCWTCAVGCKQINNQPVGFWWNRILTAAPSDVSGESSGTLSAPASDDIDVPHGTFPHVEMVYLPVACQQCDDAPCVKVCPVDATFRRDDGTVLIDFERCIGCRYCIAACPYGVRVFNWGNAEHAPDFTIGYGRDYRTDGRLVFTPDRPTGVVEKCTFCVERIDVGEQPYCVEVCPTGARVFGDLNDSSSEVSQLVTGGATQMLPDLGTDPRVFYLPVEQERNV
ncbi:MAG TPA: 4Fe-4S dicluster domain-containing protein [Solirubrobacteraceae bacterium]|nr:4Fe-4S dicluster domain-containing protein [Solirubrobacteraceae bacterium]